MSTALTRRLPIGPVQVFWNNVRLGSPKSRALVRYSKTSVQGYIGDSPLAVMDHKTREEMEVEVSIADLELSQLRYAFDQANTYQSADTLLSRVFTASTDSHVLMFGPEEVRLSGTANATVEQASFDTGTIDVWSPDLMTEYISATDFTVTEANGEIARKAGGDIPDGGVVLVYYREAQSARRLDIGGRFEDFEAELRLAHKLRTGKMLNFVFHRAKSMGSRDIEIVQDGEFPGVPMTFKILGDLSENPGAQLAQALVEI